MDTVHGAGNDPVRVRHAQRAALPVFSVDTPEQAWAAIGYYGVHRYDGSYRWTGWPRDLDPYDFERGLHEIQNVTATLQEWWEQHHP